MDTDSNFVWVVTDTDLPRVRMAWGKRTKSHTIYQVFPDGIEGRNACLAFYRDLVAKRREDDSKYAHLGIRPSPYRKIGFHRAPARQYPTTETRSMNGWYSMDDVEAKRKRAQKAAAEARKKARS